MLRPLQVRKFKNLSRTAPFVNWIGNTALPFGSRLSSSNDANTQLARNGWMGGCWIGGLFGGPPAAGIPVTRDSAMTVSTVYACSQARAETLASLPSTVYKEVDRYTRRHDSDNQVWRLLHDQPNPHMDSMKKTFCELM